MSYSEELEDRIDHHLIDNMELVKNKNLGWVGWLLNGHMCFGIFEDHLIIRVDTPLARALLEKSGVEYFKQAEQTAGKILSIAPEIHENDQVLHQFIARSMKYTASLPPKKDDQQTESVTG